jgi:hypothetical protein
MKQSVPIQRLTNRINRIETEIIAIRQELEAIPEQQNQRSYPDTSDVSLFVDKSMLKEQMRQFLLKLSIEGEPIGYEALQEQMREAGLEENELSQSIIAARNEGLEILDPEVETLAKLQSTLASA